MFINIIILILLLGKVAQIIKYISNKIMNVTQYLARYIYLIFNIVILHTSSIGNTCCLLWFIYACMFDLRFIIEVFLFNCVILNSLFYYLMSHSLCLLSCLIRIKLLLFMHIFIYVLAIIVIKCMKRPMTGYKFHSIILFEFFFWYLRWYNE